MNIGEDEFHDLFFHLWNSTPGELADIWQREPVGITTHKFQTNYAKSLFKWCLHRPHHSWIFKSIFSDCGMQKNPLVSCTYFFGEGEICLWRERSLTHWRGYALFTVWVWAKKFVNYMVLAKRCGSQAKVCIQALLSHCLLKQETLLQIFVSLHPCELMTVQVKLSCKMWSKGEQQYS